MSAETLTRLPYEADAELVERWCDAKGLPVTAAILAGLRGGRRRYGDGEPADVVVLAERDGAGELVSWQTADPDGFGKALSAKGRAAPIWLPADAADPPPDGTRPRLLIVEGMSDYTAACWLAAAAWRDGSGWLIPIGMPGTSLAGRAAERATGLARTLEEPVTAVAATDADAAGDKAAETLHGALTHRMPVARWRPAEGKDLKDEIETRGVTDVLSGLRAAAEAAEAGWRPPLRGKQMPAASTAPPGERKPRGRSRDPKARIEAWWAKAEPDLRAAPTGDRNNRVSAAAHSLGKFVAREGLPPDAADGVLDEITGIARSLGLPASEWGDKQTRRSFDSGRSA